MPGPYEVDLDALDHCVARMSSLEQTIEAQLRQVDDRIQKVHAIWTGQAAQAQLAAHREWMAGAEEMRTGLIALRKAAATAHANYTAAITANQKMWA